MWKFNYNTLEWTFIGGVIATSDKGSSSWPSARYLGAQWIDNDGTLWLFGGWGVLPDGSQCTCDLFSVNLTSFQGG